MRIRSLVLAAATLAAPAIAGTLGNLTSNGSDGSFNLGALAGFGNQWYFNTDNGQLSEGGLPFQGFPARATFAPTAVLQTGGPTVNVFNFTSFGVPQGFQVTTFGSAPAAFLSTGDVTIAGDLILKSGAAAAGTNLPTNGGGGARGGGAGEGNGFSFQYNNGGVCCTIAATDGSGGGGGMVSPGQGGEPGVPQYYPSFPTLVQRAAGAGGAAASDLSILAGGGGGGGSGTGFGGQGGVGGAGGGAVLIETPGDFIITSTGQLVADGAGGTAGAEGALTGQGGGGGGGFLWFTVGGEWLNDGLVSAHGGAGGVGCCNTEFSTVTGYYWGPTSAGGAGSGGYVNIDPPSSIVNNGIIDVRDGNGGTTYGGAVNLNGVALGGTGQIEGGSATAPEPGTWILFAAPLAGLLIRGGAGRKRRKPVHRPMIDCLDVSHEPSTLSSNSSRRDRAFPVAG